MTMLEFRNHPDDESLECFILKTAQGELESLELHLLSCSSCIDRLEFLEKEIAAIRLALRKGLEDQPIAQSLSAATPEVGDEVEPDVGMNMKASQSRTHCSPILTDSTRCFQRLCLLPRIGSPSFIERRASRSRKLFGTD